MVLGQKTFSVQNHFRQVLQTYMSSFPRVNYKSSYLLKDPNVHLFLHEKKELQELLYFLHVLNNYFKCFFNLANELGSKGKHKT